MLDRHSLKERGRRLVTDRPVDLRDFRATLEHIFARANPETDLYVFSNLSMDTLDYSGPHVNKGSKGVWLRDPVRDLPRVFSAAALPPGVGDVLVFCGGCLASGRRPTRASRTRPRAAKSPMNFLWTTVTRFEPAADIHAAATRVVPHHLSYSAPVLVDARIKPWYPNEVTCREDVAATATRH